MDGCNRPYQTWVFVYAHDSAQDAVYFHTPNENKDNFPVRFQEAVADSVTPQLFREFVDNKKFLIGHFTFEGDTVYVVYSKDHGISPLAVEGNERL